MSIEAAGLNAPADPELLREFAQNIFLEFEFVQPYFDDPEMLEERHNVSKHGIFGLGHGLQLASSIHLLDATHEGFYEVTVQNRCSIPIGVLQDDWDPESFIAALGYSRVDSVGGVYVDDDQDFTNTYQGLVRDKSGEVIDLEEIAAGELYYQEEIILECRDTGELEVEAIKEAYFGIDDKEDEAHLTVGVEPRDCNIGPIEDEFTFSDSDSAVQDELEFTEMTEGIKTVTVQDLILAGIQIKRAGVVSRSFEAFDGAPDSVDYEFDWGRLLLS